MVRLKGRGTIVKKGGENRNLNKKPGKVSWKWLQYPQKSLTMEFTAFQKGRRELC